LKGSASNSEMTQSSFQQTTSDFTIRGRVQPGSKNLWLKEYRLDSSSPAPTESLRSSAPEKFERPTFLCRVRGFAF
jgi:hypothetical protein